MSRRGWAAALTMALCAVLLAGWQAGWLGHRDASPGPVSAARAPASGASAAPGGAQPAVAALPSAVHAQVAPAEAAASGVELCGVGRFESLKDGSPAARQAEAAMETARLQTSRQTLAALLASPDDTARAAGLLLQAGGFAQPTGDILPCDGDDCSANAAAASARVLRLQEEGAPAVDALVAMAQTTRSPTIYALARQACRTPPPGADHCGTLGAARWAELEPGNATAWLEAAAEAEREHDVAGVETALHRAALAPGHRSATDGLMAAVLAHVPPQAQGWPRLGVVVEALAMQLSGGLGGLSVLTRHCSADAVADSNRRQSCAALAEALLERGTSMTDLNMGLRLAERTGMPTERLAAARTDVERLNAEGAARSKRIVAVAQRPGCRGVNEGLDFFVAIARDGDVATLRRLAVDRPAPALR